MAGKAKNNQKRPAQTRRPLTVSRSELLVDGSDRQFRAVLHDLLAFSARLQEIRNRFGRHIGLTGPQYTILISIAHKQGAAGVGINTIADHLHTSGPFITTEINRLIAAKLVQKRDNEEDRRRVLVTLTPKGHELLAKLTEIQVPVNNKLFEPLSASDFERLGRIMNRLVDSADASLALLQLLSPSGRAGRQDL